MRTEPPSPKKPHTCDGMFFCHKSGDMYCEHKDCDCHAEED